MTEPLSAKTLSEILEHADKDLGSQFHTIHTNLSKQFQTRWCARWPEGNDHSPGHITRVLNNLARLLGPEPLKHVSSLELFIAMVAIAAHDIGMIRGRDEHPKASGDIIEHIASSNPMLFDRGWLPFLKAAVRCHGSRADIKAECRTWQESENVAGHMVRPRLLAGIVRLADELDETRERALEWVQSVIGVPKTSMPYWEFCQKIRGIEILGPRADITFSVDFETNDVKRAIVTDKGESYFLRFFADKIAKIHREKEYVRAFIGDLAGKDLKVSVSPTESNVLWTVPRVITFSKGMYDAETDAEAAIGAFLLHFPESVARPPR